MSTSSRIVQGTSSPTSPHTMMESSSSSTLDDVNVESLFHKSNLDIKKALRNLLMCLLVGRFTLAMTDPCWKLEDASFEMLEKRLRSALATPSLGAAGGMQSRIPAPFGSLSERSVLETIARKITSLTRVLSEEDKASSARLIVMTFASLPAAIRAEIFGDEDPAFYSSQESDFFAAFQKKFFQPLESFFMEDKELSEDLAPYAEIARQVLYPH